MSGGGGERWTGGVGGRSPDAGGPDADGPEQLVASQARIPVAAVRIEDPELRAPAGRPEPAARDEHLRPLPDDVPSETDP